MRRLFAVVAVVAVGLSSLAMGIGVGPSRVAAIPPGFTDTVVPNPPSNPLDQPTTIISMNGGRAMILEKTGHVRLLLADGTISANDALTLAVCTGSEMGLLGAALDPAFGANGYVYLYYSHSTGDCASQTGRANRVSRFTMGGETINPASEVVLLDNIAAYGGNHDGGDLEVGQDGYLYVSIGDAGQNPRAPHTGTAASDLSLLNGKIVRITTTGGVPTDNPFAADPNGVSCATAGTAAPVNKRCIEIYSWGLRNPYRFAFDPNAGNTRFFINDVGQNTTEEVDVGGAGLDYGWNTREGFCATGQVTPCTAAPAGFTDPITTYEHSSLCTYITAGAFVPNGVWPAQYDNSYLFSDGGCNKIFKLPSVGSVDYNAPFAQAVGGIVDMAFVVQGADPALYYVSNGSGQLHKITYDAPVAPPSPALAFTPVTPSTRVYDTRVNIGIPAGTMRGGTTRLVDLGITDPTVKAALVNITMVDPSGGGYVTASQPRTEHPATSNVNAGSGDIVANASIVPLDGSGRLLLYTFVTTDVIVDVMGTFKQIAPTGSGGRYQALSPRRLIDTREPFSATNNFTRTDSGGVADVNASSRAGLPPSVLAVALIVTGVSGPGPAKGHITVYPGGTALPPSSNLNVNGFDDVRPNLVVVPLGADGSVNFRLSSTAHVVVDVAGFFWEDTNPIGLYHLISPSRQVDTRIPLGFGPLAAAAFASLKPAGSVPSIAVAVSQNVTLTQTKTGGFVTAYPSDEQRPFTSNANSSGPDQDRAAFSFTKVGARGTGSIAYYSSSGTDLVVDITGYFD